MTPRGPFCKPLPQDEIVLIVVDIEAEAAKWGLDQAQGSVEHGGAQGLDQGSVLLLGVPGGRRGEAHFLERGHLAAYASARVADGKATTLADGEGTEAGNADAVAALHVRNDGVAKGVDHVGSVLLAALVVTGNLVDDIGLGHGVTLRTGSAIGRKMVPAFQAE